jgi:LacI family transcriptional regulator
MAGVSVSTVSRVINESGYVGAATRAKVEEAMKELGFSPNGVARGLVSGKTGSIGLLIPDVSNPFFSDIARGAEDAAIAEGFTVILCNSDWKIERERMYLDILHGKWVEGVIVAGSRSPEDVLLDSIGDMPFSLVDRQPSHVGASVWMDNERGAVVAVSHLLEMGCHSLAYITGPEHSPSAHARHMGFNQAVKSAPSISRVRVVRGDFRYDGGFKAGLQLLSGGELPDGIFAANDLMAIGVIQAAQSLGIRIPQDIAVIGYDNISMSTYIAPKLTTINQPGYEMGKAAFTMLHQRLQRGKTSLKAIEFEPKLILRESTIRESCGSIQL